jgi:hypothetical protein
MVISLITIFYNDPGRSGSTVGCRFSGSVCRIFQCDVHWEKIWNPYYKICNWTTKSIFFSVLVLCTQVNMIFVMLLWVNIHSGRAWKICPATVGIEPTKSIVYPYYFNTISIVWKYTIIMDNQNPFYFQKMSIQFSFYDLLWIFNFFPVVDGPTSAN